MKKSFHAIGLSAAVFLTCATCFIASPAVAITPTGASSTAPVLPVVTVRPTANGGDQADALQAAFDALQPGQHLVIAPGRYLVSRSLLVSKPDVVISGYGATLVATTPDDQALVMQGSGATLVGVTLLGTGSTRLSALRAWKVAVSGTNMQVLDVTIHGGASAGIVVLDASKVAIVGNHVEATLSDGIHTTLGSTDVLVQGNTVKGTGDDLISVVSYQGDGRLSGNVLIDRNSVSGNYWGRGISVVGGRAVTISNNDVAGVQKAAGILVAQEDSWHTYGASDVRIENNVVSAIQDGTNANNGLQPTQQGAIELDTWSGAVSHVIVRGNRVSGSGHAGFRAIGNVCHFSVADNTFASIAGVPVSLITNGCSPAGMVVSGNSMDGVALASPVGATTSGAIPAGGAVTASLPTVRRNLIQMKAASTSTRK
ncbi:nitrous oxide reductase family maturation protein NosD [Burkholderia pseudomultivorans]|uniref:right-handed parallel beta-helix repeat-containing protein n=1 Tax=Burkholderia pseudomultivorans TaxID=1207504 RepID=UPI000753E9F7|nr:right-handed parallel beta-helix repeat-containing protein [Burkholderia pseudomultivorans]KVG63362.1 hypothetical protein WS80_21790 [Burkholderia pseudomultivorans]